MLLTPYPRHLTLTDTAFPLPPNGFIRIENPALLGEGQWAKDAFPYPYTLTAAPVEALLFLRVDAALGAQHYTLRIDAEGITVTGGDAAGVFYGVCTLRQILMQHQNSLPGLVIEDGPDYVQRGYMLDISRDKVPTLDTLFLLVDELAALKINQLQLYTEHTFAYAGHEAVWRDASPLTAEDILRLDAHCRQRHIALIPNQNSLGHMERWLRHYPHLALVADGFTNPAGDWKPPSTLNPLHPASFPLITELYDHLLPNFTQKTVNVGCDEPFELASQLPGQDGRIYLDWLLKLYEDLTRRGYRMMFWGDIITHHPDLVPELPPDVTVLAWGYEAIDPLDKQARQFAAAGIPFYICPGTSSWNALVGRAQNALDNLRNAAQIGLEYGAAGYLITDWGDNGHWQPLVASYVGMVYGAAVSWGYTANRDLDVIAALDTFIYNDAAHVMGEFTMTIGNLYRRIGPEYINGQVLTYALQWPLETIHARLAQVAGWSGGIPANVSPDTLRTVMGEIDRLTALLPQAQMQRMDAGLILAEWAQAAALLRCGAAWLLYAQGAAPTLEADIDALIETQKALWLRRNRPGGLSDSLRRFDHLFA
ncbi:MAG: hypothetical protein OHK0046_23700 [Anaerolineae bacterium]